MHNRSTITVSRQDEEQILARIARGDKISDIAAAYSLSTQAIYAIKKRNPDTLAELIDTNTEYQRKKARTILDKANSKIEELLDEDDDKEDGKKLSVGQLLAISREMHTQSKEDDAPPPTNPLNAEQTLAAIGAALKDGNEVELTKLAFKRNDG